MVKLYIKCSTADLHTAAPLITLAATWQWDPEQPAERGLPAVPAGAAIPSSIPQAAASCQAHPSLANG